MKTQRELRVSVNHQTSHSLERMSQPADAVSGCEESPWAARGELSGSHSDQYTAQRLWKKQSKLCAGGRLGAGWGPGKRKATLPHWET